MAEAENVKAILNKGADDLEQGITLTARARTTMDDLRADLNKALRQIEKLQREYLSAIAKIRDGRTPISQAAAGTGNRAVSAAIGEVSKVEENLTEDLKTLTTMKYAIEDVLKSAAIPHTEAARIALRRTIEVFRTYADIL